MSRESRAETWPNIALPFCTIQRSKMAKVRLVGERSESDRRGDFTEIDPETGFLLRVSFSKDRRNRCMHRCLYRESENSRFREEKRKERDEKIGELWIIELGIRESDVIRSFLIRRLKFYLGNFVSSNNWTSVDHF